MCLCEYKNTLYTCEGWSANTRETHVEGEGKKRKETNDADP